MSGPGAVPHHGDLIAVLGVLQIAVNQHSDQQGEQDTHIQSELANHNSWESHFLPEVKKHWPCGRGVQEEVPLRLSLPQEDEEIQGYIVEHQGHQGLIGAELHFQHRSQGTIYPGSGHASQAHQDQNHSLGQAVLQLKGHGGGGHRPENELSLAANVPEAHLEGQGQGHRGEHQGNKYLQIILKGLIGNLIAYHTHSKHPLVISNGIHPHDQQQQPAQNQGSGHRSQVETQLLPERTAVPLYDMDGQSSPSWLPLSCCSSSCSSWALMLVSRAMPAGLSSYL